MPTVNIYHKDKSGAEKILPLIPRLKEYIAGKLSCGDRKLNSGEMTIRLISTEGDSMIGNIELEITAHAYKERIEQQDNICLDVREHIMGEIPSAGDVRVWLKLCELGHSWED